MEASPEKIVIEPWDEHNRELVRNVHPPDWVNPEPARRYNVVVVGAGTAGLVTAAAAAGLGAKVALVERELMGGDCLNVGCVPSKALLSAGRAYARVRDAAKLGIALPGQPTVDFGAVMERMRRIRAQMSANDSASRFRRLGVDVFLGGARFVSRDAIEVGGKRLRFRRAVIATGARASAPPIPGLAEAGYLTNETVFALTSLPRRLAVIGAGPLGCELAQAFARFGSEVHLLEALDRVLSREDRDAAERVADALARDGVQLACGRNIVRVERRGADKVLELDRDGERSEVHVDEILVGSGRAPNVAGLNLEAAGVEYDAESGVKVDDRLGTKNPKIFAAGDVCSPYRFTHNSDFQARIVVQNALFFGREKASALTIPWVTYTDPELAHVGLYAHEARERGIAVRTFVQELAEVDRAILDGETEGFVRLHVREGGDDIVGATIVAADAGEMISEVTLAMVGRLGLGTIARMIHPYPTRSEAVRKIADAYNRTRLTPRVRALFEKWFRWMR
jgi:pyruvate/2-oxoglutarate dehydrogenase complex dihydrolipoamide dehydrogenase (E3) component